MLKPNVLVRFILPQTQSCAALIRSIDEKEFGCRLYIYITIARIGQVVKREFCSGDRL